MGKQHAPLLVNIYFRLTVSLRHFPNKPIRCRSPRQSHCPCSPPPAPFTGCATLSPFSAVLLINDSRWDDASKVSFPSMMNPSFRRHSSLSGDWRGTSPLVTFDSITHSLYKPRFLDQFGYTAAPEGWRCSRVGLHFDAPR